MACRVFIVDDDDLFVEFLTLLLEGDGRFEIIGRARDGREALDLVPAADADVVTMDIEMPELDGLSATTRLLADNADLRVVIVSSSIVAGSVADARACGAVGYVSKARAADELAEVLLAACRGVSFAAVA